MVYVSAALPLLKQKIRSWTKSSLSATLSAMNYPDVVLESAPMITPPS